jgi:hypothetical protein
MSDYSELKRLAIEADPNSCTGLQYSDFRSACRPEVILALIAESERVKARLCVCHDCAGQGEIYSGRHSHHGYNQPPEPVMHVCGTCDGDGILGSLEDFESLAAEHDQLKAENEALRKDAKRYRWVLENASVILDKKTAYQAETGFIKFDTMPGRTEAESAINAAMIAGEKS